MIYIIKEEINILNIRKKFMNKNKLEKEKSLLK